MVEDDPPAVKVVENDLKWARKKLRTHSEMAATVGTADVASNPVWPSVRAYGPIVPITGGRSAN